MSEILDRPPTAPGPTGGSPGSPGRGATGPEPPALPAGLGRNWVGLVLVAAVLVLVTVQWGWGALAIIAALAISIALHEAGHYLAARWAGMKVTEFFLGFGPRIWSFRRGETEYGLKVIPAGAYVRIVGMSNLEEVDPADEARSYRSKSYPKRLVAVLAGPFANLAIALVLLFVVFAGFGQRQDDGWVVGRVVEGSAAAAMGVQGGDRLVAVDGTPVEDWDAFGAAVQAHAGQPVSVTVERGGQELTLQGTTGWRLTPQAAAALPPLNANDEIVSVGGRATPTFEDFRLALAEVGDGTATVLLDRWVDGSTYRYEAEVRDPGPLGPEASRGFVGISPEHLTTTEPMGVLEAGGAAVARMGEITVEAGRGLARFASPSGISNYVEMVAQGGSEPTTDGDVPALRPVDQGTPAPSATTASTSAPPEDRFISILGMLRLGSQAASIDLALFLQLVAVVNLFLGLLNLVPLLPLDGGHAAVATYEAIRGRLRGRPYRVDMAKLMPVTYVVVLVLVGIGFSAIYLDAVNPVNLPPGP